MVDGEPGEIPEEVVNETNEQTNNRLSQTRTTRRGFLERAAALATVPASIWASRHLPAPPVHHEPTPPEMPPPPVAGGENLTPVDSEVVPSFENPFHSVLANEVAKEKGITSGSYLTLEDELLEKMTAYDLPEMTDIAVESVRDYTELFKQLADEFGVPPNVQAGIVMIETAGIKHPVIRDPKLAQGIFQVMIDKFPEDKRDDYDYMNDPVNNGRAAMKFLTETCLPLARDFYAGRYANDNLVVYAKAMEVYNAGPTQAFYPRYWTEEELQQPMSDRPDLIPTQTQKYRDYFLQQCLTAEVAQNLFDRGLNRQQVIDAMSFNDIDPRAMFLQDFYSRYENTSLINYEAGKQLVASEIPGTGPITIYAEDIDTYPFPDRKTPPPTAIKEDALAHERRLARTTYENYSADPFLYKMPPGPRLWSVNGGLNTLREDPRNMQKG